MSYDSPRRFRTSLSVVLPVRDEEALIEHSVLQIHYTVAALVEDFEILVVDAGSRDRTGGLLATLSHRYPSLPLRGLRCAGGSGVGAALATGYAAAQKELIFATDGGRQYDVAELADFLAALDPKTDLMLGWRVHRADSPLGLLRGWLWNTAVNILFGYTARDVNCAFKLFRRCVWPSLTVQARGAAFSAEFLVRARCHGYRIHELPVHHFPRSGAPSGFLGLGEAFRAARDLVALRCRLPRAGCETGGEATLSATSDPTPPAAALQR
jgi:glycosyltransferase involved in cell wall biosynthesis